MKRFKRISAIFLALVLVLGLIPGGFLFVETSAESLTPSVGDGKTWLHAVYDANGISFDGKNDNTHPLDVALTSRIMIGAAWNVEYLFLSVNSDVEFTKLQVNGKDVLVKRVTAAADSDPGFAEYRISLLDAGISSIASGVNKVTVQIGEEEAQTLYLIFENNNYERGAVSTNNTETAPNRVEVIDKYTAKHKESGSISLYNADKQDLLQGKLNTPSIVELDLDIEQLFANTTTSNNDHGALPYCTYGANVQVVDEYCATVPSGNKNFAAEVFKFGFFRNKDDNALYMRHAYMENGVYKTADVLVADTVNRLLHVRAEYSYAPDAEGGVSHDSVVSAKYFVNGKLIAEATNVRIASGAAGIAQNCDKYGTLIQGGAEVTNTGNMGTEAKSLVRLYVSYADATKSAWSKVTASNYSISVNEPAALADLAEAVAVQAQIAAIGANGTITQFEVTAAKAAFDALDESVQALIPNSGNIALAQAYLDATPLTNYLHAVYAKNGDGDKPVIYLPDGAKVGAAWDWNNLYLDFGADVAEVEIGNYSGTTVSGQQVVIPWIDVLEENLTADDAQIPQTLTIVVDDVVWTGNLLLVEEDYLVENGVSAAYGATWDSNTASGKLNSIVKFTDANPYLHRDILYVNNTVKNWGEEILKLGAALDRTNILELDVVTEYLPASHTISNLYDARREFISGGISVVVIDGEAYTGGNAREGMFTGLARTGNILYFIYWNGESYVEVPVDTYQSGKEYHLRLEFTYPEDDGNGNVNNDIVNARYFVNGKLVAEDEDVKRIHGEVIGENTYNVTIATSGDGSGTHGFFVMATDLTNSENNCSDYTRVEATVKNVSVSNGQETVLNDKAAAEAVEALINAIGTVSLNSKADIDAAEAAYAALTDDQKALVANYATLTAAKTAYNDLKAPVDAVIAQIAALGNISLESEAAIVAAETAYAELTAEQQEQVSNYATLTAARATYNALKAAADKLAEDQAAAQVVIDKITALGTITLESKSAIDAAEAAYATLTEDQQALVSNYTTLTDARATYNALKAAADQAAIDQAAANGMMELIDNIGTVTLESKAVIESAEAAYEALTSEQKNLVTNYATLTAARAAYDQLVAEKKAADQAAANAVISQIEAIGTVTLDSEEAIEAAEAAYAALTDEQKALVTNYAALTAAKAAYDQLVAEKEAAEKEAADKAAADAAIAKIEAIGTVTLDSKLSIEAARVAYNSLTDEQKALVSAEVLLKLTNAETALKALETPDEPPKTGDTTMLMPVALLLTLSFVGLAVVMIGKKRFF